MKLLALLVACLSLPSFAVAAVPPPGVAVPAEERAVLEKGIAELGNEIAALRKELAAKSVLLGELPNVEIFHKSADWALRFGEFFDVKQIATAKDHLAQGMARAGALRKGGTPWNTQTGLVARGYRSKIDGSVQPYGVLVPETFKDGAKRTPVRLDFWMHGRGEKLSELSFIEGAQKSKGEFTPEGAIVCYLYGRYCCANKFAGEMDLFEAMADVKAHYPVDSQRMVVRGFSMGGASAWQFATHHSGLWAAAAPGAGFAETAEFFRSFGAGKEPPPWWEQVLWRWYDCTTMAGNLANTTTVAYSGETDGQKQSADIMTKYAAQEGLTFPHIIGPQTGHKYHPDAKPKINELVDAAAAKGREEFPKKVKLVTYTLIYSSNAWVKLTGMEKQWERAEVTAELKDDVATVTTKNVSSLELQLSGLGNPKGVKSVILDGKEFQHPNRIYWLALGKKADGWQQVGITHPDGKGGVTGSAKGLLVDGYGPKAPKICGPIDHAFMSRFVFIRPTGKPLNDIVGAWAKAEMEHAITAWRSVFRGDVIVVDDTAWLAAWDKKTAAMTPTSRFTDIQDEPNIVLWGDVSSNKVLARIAAKLPLKWDAATLTLGTQKVDAATHAPILIYPNPLNPIRYVVLNSGPTFREQAAQNNSDQTPKLPDWAVVDLRTPPGPKWPGQIVDAGFFDENWK